MLPDFTPKNERPFNVWRYVGGVKTFIGIVKGVNHTLADKRATNLYGSGVWTTERE
jgi:hypothetical protein